jgi:hypothetical protein
MNRTEEKLVQCDDNGGCGECACECHTDVAIPGPHIASCKFADPDYVPPDFVEKVSRMPITFTPNGTN